jgi:hypothetical protein
MPLVRLCSHRLLGLKLEIVFQPPRTISPAGIFPQRVAFRFNPYVYLLPPSTNDLPPDPDRKKTIPWKPFADESLRFEIRFVPCDPRPEDESTTSPSSNFLSDRNINSDISGEQLRMASPGAPFYLWFRAAAVTVPGAYRLQISGFLKTQTGTNLLAQTLSDPIHVVLSLPATERLESLDSFKRRLDEYERSRLNNSCASGERPPFWGRSMIYSEIW